MKIHLSITLYKERGKSFFSKTNSTIVSVLSPMKIVEAKIVRVLKKRYLLLVLHVHYIVSVLE